MIEVKECTLEDTALLAEMNKHLIEDENAINSDEHRHLCKMDVVQLTNRMTEFLNTDYKAFFFMINKEIVGYALCDMTKEPKYLRQFFIKREERRKHYGKIAFENLLEKIRVKEIEIDVLKWNETGLKFWENMGFKEQWKRMKYKIYE